MRSRSRLAALPVFVLLTALAAAPRAHAADGKKPAATPTPIPTPDTASDDDMPVVSDDGESRAPEQWEGHSSGSGMILGLRIGAHAFEPAGIAGDGGLAFEAVGAMPIRGPFYAGAVAGYHTGFHKAGGDNRRRFFDAEFGAIEGQYRHNVGRLNTMGGVGLGFLSANTAELTRPDGAPGSDSGASVLAHAVGGLEYQVGRLGLAGEIRYGVSPVDFKAAKETLPMGGLTIAVGFDLGF